MTKTKTILAALALIAVSSFAVSCKKKNKSGLSDKIQSIISEALVDSLKKRGMVIHEGSTPPIVEGIYLLSPNELTSNFGPGDSWQPGRIIDDYKHKFYDQSGDEVKKDYKSSTGSDVGAGQGSYLSGSGNAFTMFTEDAGVSNGVAYKNVSVISGIITDEGIKDFQHAFIMTEKTNDDENNILIPVGASRVYKDSDGLAEIAPFYKPSAPAEEQNDSKGSVADNK